MLSINGNDLGTYIRGLFAFILGRISLNLCNALTTRFYAVFGLFKVEFLLVHRFLHVLWLGNHVDFHSSL